ncbi:MAG: response regulator [Deltaproteobacteria bacterium]|nr:response regulator [Deltaproteobacteria bacterium]
MKESIDWLVHLDDMAERVYGRAAAFFSDDREFSEFLTQLAWGEALQSRIIGEVAECISNNKNNYTSQISLDEDTKRGIESPLVECGNKTDEGKITKEEMLEYMVCYEFSEWNDILLSLIENFKEYSIGFNFIAAKVQQHKRNIERFAELHPELKRFIGNKRSLRPLWQENLLIVDDSDAIIRLLSSILAKEGVIEGAPDGKSALSKLGEKHYSVIITDVGMPLMNGIEFYKRASKIYPNIRERILFYTALDDKGSVSFFKENNLTYLIKPAEISELRKTVGNILNR